MANTTAQPEMAFEGIVTLQRLRAATEALRQRGNIRKSGIRNWDDPVVEYWDKLSLIQGEEFRVPESD